LNGGIPDRDIDALDRYWKVIPSVRTALFEQADRTAYSQLRVPSAEIKTTIFSHSEFTAFNEAATRLFKKWKAATIPRLKALTEGSHPKALIEEISEDLLATFEKAPLLDPYDIYQHLMDYWAETMQDDCYLIAGDGWYKAAQPRLIVEENGKKSKAKPDFTLGRKKYQAELIPPSLIIARYFATEQSVIESWEAQIAALAQQIEELAEERGGEGGLLFEAQNDKGKLTKASVRNRLSEAKEGGVDVAEPGEIPLLEQYLILVEKESETSTKLKTLQDVLTELVAEKYPLLTEAEIQALVVEEKWLATIAAAIQGELDRVSQTLTGRIQQLAQRYESPLQQLTDEVFSLSTRVEQHLKRMGASVI